MTPLFAAIDGRQWATVDMLLEVKASINSPSGLASNVLNAALFIHRPALFRCLLKKGAQVDFSDEEIMRNTFLLKSVLVELKSHGSLSGNPELTHHILDTTITREIPCIWSSVQLILQSGLLDRNLLSIALGSFIRFQSMFGLSSEAIHRVNLLLELGAPINGMGVRAKDCGDKRARTCLQIAIQARQQNGKRYSYFERRLIEIMRILLENGVDPNLDGVGPDFLGATPLQLTIMEHWTAAVQLLLEFKANPNQIGRRCAHTPLQLAVRDGNIAVVQLLLQHGANVDAPAAEWNGATALQFAAIGGYLGLVHLLLEHGADVNAPAGKHEGRTALEGAAEHGRLDIVQYLLNAGAFVVGEGEERYEKAIERASRYGHLTTSRLLKEYRAQFVD